MSTSNLERLIAMSETAERSLQEHLVGATGASQLVRVGRVRDDLARISTDAQEVHRNELVQVLDSRAAELAQQGSSSLLEQVNVTWGLSWSAVARMIGVSDTAVRKWRRGETVSPENLRQLARSVAFLGLVKEQGWISDVAAWLEMRIAEASTLTPADLYPTHVDVLFELATHRIDPHEALMRFDASWQERYSVDSRVEVSLADDGPVLRLRAGEEE
jgi:transcriptional regulator with XRE-family HTH domain